MKHLIHTTIILVFVSLLVHSPFYGQKESIDSKVVLISVDGAADWILDDLMSRNILTENGAFSKIRNSGTYAESMVPIALSATAVSHISLYTGTHPEVHGIVGNNILMPGDTILGPRATSGFKAPIKSETIWQAAIRQGKKVTNINAVGQDNSTENRKGSKTFSYGKKLANSIVSDLYSNTQDKKILLEDFENIKELETKSVLSFKPFDGKEIPVFCFAIDSTFDGITNYDEIIIDFDKNLGNGHSGKLKTNRWSEIKFMIGDQKVSSWSYLMNLNSITAKAQIYLGAIGFNPSSPNDFKKEMETKVGLWPCEQDNIKLSKGLITEQMWFDQAERLAKYYQKLLLANIKKGDWDLLSGYFTLVDDVQHRFLLKDKRQLDYTLENGNRQKRYNKYVEWAYRTVDNLINEVILKAPKGIDFVIISDHGVAPIHSVLLINSFLEKNGISVKGDSIEARAYTTGPSAHIYINIKDRQGKGTVPKNERFKYIEKIVKACKNLKDPISGLSIFSIVLRANELDKLHLGFPKRSGDIFVSARIGWSLSAKLVSGLPTIIPNTFNKDAYAHLDENIQQFLSFGFMNETGLGVHGNLGSERKMHSIFYAIGPNVPNHKLGLISTLDVTPTISGLLNVKPPKKAIGTDLLKN